MNVKQGDLAIVIKSSAGNEMKVCKVLRASNANSVMVGQTFSDFINGRDGRFRRDLNGFFWVVEYPSAVMNIDGQLVRQAFMQDAWLRPISGIPDTEEENKEKELEK